MRYRIKIVTYENGRKEYYAQYKTWLGWVYLHYDGSETSVDVEARTRENALDRIDNHFNGNCKPQKIDFEYITK